MRSDQEIEDFTDGAFSCGLLREREMVLHDVTIAAAVALFDDVPGRGEVGHDRVCAAFSDAQLVRDIAQANAGIVRDAQKGTAVVREEPPIGHMSTIAINF